jgi:hypothetical protein
MKNIFLYIFFILIILISLFTQNYSNNIREHFVPKQIKEYYRPIARHMRIGYEGFYDKSSLDLLNLFRKFKIL